MLYIGHFYFDGQGSDGEERCGHFTCLAEADSVEKSVKKFMEHIHEIRDSSNLFDGSFEIYLDDVVEIQKLPEKAISLDFMSYPQQSPEGQEMRKWIVKNIQPIDKKKLYLDPPDRV